MGLCGCDENREPIYYLEVFQAHSYRYHCFTEPPQNTVVSSPTNYFYLSLSVTKDENGY